MTLTVNALLTRILFLVFFQPSLTMMLSLYLFSELLVLRVFLQLPHTTLQ